ncbi:MAG: rRNA pseudouridine synthase [Kiritimatiellae bacterium]|nr:rRNA pseudouridine synthase [Kiritimatiellia bacterium]
MAEGVRLQKVLAERGVASRRGSAEIVAAGRVTVNGAIVTEAGLRVDPLQDCIMVDGAPLPVEREGKRTILLYKPRGYICSRSAKDGKTVYELLKGVSERIVPVGRLDKDSEGLLLLSNDGDLVERFTHPRFEQEKVYRVTVSGSLAPEVLSELESPIEIEGYTTVPATITVLKREPRPVLEFVLNEGRNRQVRRLCERSGLKVHRLVRTRIGSVSLSGLKPGQWRDL